MCKYKQSTVSKRLLYNEVISLGRKAAKTIGGLVINKIL